MSIEEKLTWDEIVDKYPGRWVALVDCQMDGVCLVSAKIFGVCNDNRERLSMERELVSREIPFIWRRTTEEMGAVIL